MNSEQPAATELRGVLGLTAERIVENGTLSERRVLQAISDASAEACPGAAAALVDWSGSEISRLRAFGVVHGAVLDALGPDAQSWLLDELLDKVRDISSARVA